MAGRLGDLGGAGGGLAEEARPWRSLRKGLAGEGARCSLFFSAKEWCGLCGGGGGFRESAALAPAFSVSMVPAAGEGAGEGRTLEALRVLPGRRSHGGGRRAQQRQRLPPAFPVALSSLLLLPPRSAHFPPRGATQSTTRPPALPAPALGGESKRRADPFPPARSARCSSRERRRRLQQGLLPPRPRGGRPSAGSLRRSRRRRIILHSSREPFSPPEPRPPRPPPLRSAPHLPISPGSFLLALAPEIERTASAAVSDTDAAPSVRMSLPFCQPAKLFSAQATFSSSTPHAFLSRLPCRL